MWFKIVLYTSVVFEVVYITYIKYSQYAELCVEFV